MKIVTFEEPHYHNERLGLWLDGGPVVDANLGFAGMLKEEQGVDYPSRFAAAFVPPNMTEFLEGGEKSMQAMHDLSKFIIKKGATNVTGPEGEAIRFDYSKLKIKAPIPRPGKIIHTAGNFREHANEGSSSGWEFPIPHWISFLKRPDAIIGNNENVIYPSFTKELDHEIELAIVIGKKCKKLKDEKEAWDSIAGFTIFNDITARDIQKEEMKTGILNFGKNLDTFALFGPCFVPKEDIGDVTNLKIECRVNGDPRQVSNTGHLSVSVPKIVEHYSWVTLYPGDIVTTGTVSGVAAFRKDAEKYYLKPGDILESEIENIGILRNYIVEEK